MTLLLLKNIVKSYKNDYTNILKTFLSNFTKKNLKI